MWFSVKDALGYWSDMFINTVQAKEMTVTDGSYDNFRNNYVVANSISTIKYDKENDFKKFLPTTKIVRLPTDTSVLIEGQCVAWINYVTGLNWSGNAIEWKSYINSNVPGDGKIVVMNVGRFGHLGGQIDETDTKILIRSRNWENKWVVSDNWFDKDDARILGYIEYTKSKNLFSIKLN